MKYLFVPYEIAKQLKEKGFDIECLGYINEEGKTYLFDLKPLANWGLEHNPKYKGILSPLYQQVIDWLREKSVKIVENPNFEYEIWLRNVEGLYEVKFDYMPLNVAIEEALKLI